MMAAHDKPLRSKVNMAALGLALVVTAFCALSVHVIMLQWLDVPYPIDHAPLWAKWLNIVSVVAGVLAFLRFSRPSLGPLRRLNRFVIVAALYAACHETLRFYIMNSVVTTSWAFPAIQLIQPLLQAVVISFLCAVAIRWARSLAHYIVISLIVGGIILLANMLIDAALAPLFAHFSYLSHADVFQEPYPLEVLVPAYVSFLEPVIAAAIMAKLTWAELPSGRVCRILTFAILMLAIRGIAVRPFLYCFFMAGPPLSGMVSQSQFFLEYLVVGLAVGTAWEAFAASRAPAEMTVD